MEHNVVITNNVNKGFLLTVKRLQHNIKWAKLRWNLFYIMFKIYWEGKTSKCYQVVASGQPLFINTFLNFLQKKMNNFIICQRVTEYMYLYAYICVKQLQWKCLTSCSSLIHLLLFLCLTFLPKLAGSN